MKGIAVRVLVAVATFAALVTSASAQDLQPGTDHHGKGGTGDNVQHPLGKK